MTETLEKKVQKKNQKIRAPYRVSVRSEKKKIVKKIKKAKKKTVGKKLCIFFSINPRRHRAAEDPNPTEKKVREKIFFVIFHDGSPPPVEGGPERGRRAFSSGFV